MYVPDVIPEKDRSTLVNKGGYGRDVEIGDTPALLVVDMTREFVEDRFPNGWSETGKPAARSIARLADVAAEQGIRTYYTRMQKNTTYSERGRWGDTTETIELGPEAREFAEPLSPGEDDVIINKAKPSAFFGTQLESILNYDGVDSLIITGMTTSGCVRASVIDAFSYNYFVTVPEECVADRAGISHEVNLFEMDMKYGSVQSLEDVLAAIKR